MAYRSIAASVALTKNDVPRDRNFGPRAEGRRSSLALDRARRSVTRVCTLNVYGDALCYAEDVARLHERRIVAQMLRVTRAPSGERP